MLVRCVLSGIISCASRYNRLRDSQGLNCSVALSGTESTRLGVLRTSVLPDAEGSTGTIFVLRLPNYNRLTDNITIIN